MRSPFFSELEAYHFLLLTVAALSAIVIASIAGGAWAGVPVGAALMIVATLVYARRGRPQRRLKTAPPLVGTEDRRRVLVLAHDAVGADTVDEIRRLTAGYPAEVLVVCPVPVSTVRRWASDLDGARMLAGATLETSLQTLQDAGIDARGAIGDEDAARSVEDALRIFSADEIVVCTTGDGVGAASVERVRERFALPVAHVNRRLVLFRSLD